MECRVITALEREIINPPMAQTKAKACLCSRKSRRNMSNPPVRSSDERRTRLGRGVKRGRVGPSPHLFLLLVREWNRQPNWNHRWIQFSQLPAPSSCRHRPILNSPPPSSAPSALAPDPEFPQHKHSMRRRRSPFPIKRPSSPPIGWHRRAHGSSQFASPVSC